MFISTDPGGENLVDVSLGDCREAVIYRSCSLGMLFIVDRPQGKDKGKDSVFVVTQYSLEIAGLGSAKGEGNSCRETQGMDGGSYIVTKRHKSCFPSQLDSLFPELLGHGFSVCGG